MHGKLFFLVLVICATIGCAGHIGKAPVFYENSNGDVVEAANTADGLSLAIGTSAAGSSSGGSISEAGAGLVGGIAKTIAAVFAPISAIVTGVFGGQTVAD